MVFAGFVHLFDPPKPDVLDTINKLHDIGISFKMITGDNQLVAAYIANQIGMPDPVILTGRDLQKISPEALVLRAQQTNIFAEIEPQQKESIILALQKAGNTVAYMGDGINDVSAINAADVGISINNAVDVAKDAADVVLLEKDLLVLRAGVVEGRRTFVNTLKYIYINTGATFGDMFSVAIVSLVLPFLPMLPEQILLTNFLTDYPYMAVASDNVDEDQLHKPQRWQLKQIKNFMIVFGLHSAVFHFITFWVLYGMYRTSPGIFQSAWFLEEVFVELLILFVVRTHHSIFRSRPGKWLFILNSTAFVITLILLFTPLGHIIKLQPLPGQLIAIISGILLAYTITAEMLKLVFFKNSD
jgi:Mg2+-importing ATPase